MFPPPPLFKSRVITVPTHNLENNFPHVNQLNQSNQIVSRNINFHKTSVFVPKQNERNNGDF